MSRTTKGRLYTRSTKKHGRIYCLDYSVKGERFRHKLVDEKGQPITTKKQAELIADTILRPYRARTEATRLRMAKDALSTAEQVATDAEIAALPKMEIERMWARSPWIVNCRGATERRLSPSTIVDNEGMWRRFVTWATNHELIHAESVTSAHATDFRDAIMDSGVSGSRANKIVLCCRVMFKLAGITPNPFDGVRKLAHRPSRRRELTEDELTRICRAAHGEMKPLLAIGLYVGGMRLGDACQLSWDEIDRSFTRIIRINSKTGKEVAVPIRPELAMILQELPRSPGKHVMPEFAKMYKLERSRVSKRVQEHFRLCGIETHRAGTGYRSPKDKKVRAVVEVGYHSLRHSFITICARAGVPLHVIQSLAGHSSPAMQSIYLHSSQADEERAIAALPSVTGKPDPEAADRAKLMTLIESIPIELVRDIIDQIEKTNEQP